MSASSQSKDLKRYIGYSTDVKKHSHHHNHASNGITSSSSDSRGHTISETQNGKKKHNIDYDYENTLGYIPNHKQINSQFINEIIPQQPTDQLKKERRNKDRLQHLSKLLPQKARWIGYLDVGCGNAEITATIAQQMGIGNVYGIDMFEEDDFNQPCMDLEIKYLQNNKNKIEIAQNSVDLITCFMAIHHFEHLDQMLREIQRVLLIDGYLFIREHDVPHKDKQLKAYIEDMHRKYPDHPTDGYMMLFDREYLREILNGYGFTHLGDSDYTGLNPQAVYHSLYILKTKEINPKVAQLIHKKQPSESTSSLDESEITSNNQSGRESMSSDDGAEFQKLSLSMKSSVEQYNKNSFKDTQSNLILSQQQSSKEQLDNEDISSPPIKNKLPSQQQNNNNSIHNQNSSSAKKTNNNLSDKHSHVINKKNKFDEIDVYANIISVQPQKQQSQTKSAPSSKVEKKQLQQSQPIQIQAFQEEEQSYEISSNFNETQKSSLLDDDGFVVVVKNSKKQQQKNNGQTNQPVSKKIVDQTESKPKKQQEQPITLSKSESDEWISVGNPRNNSLQSKHNQEQEKEEENNDDDKNTSSSIKESSNQFIYIQQKNIKKKNRK